jgi:biopolymer transport protein ExbB/TolQ
LWIVAKMSPSLLTPIGLVVGGVVGYFIKRLVSQNDKTMSELDQRIEEIHKRSVRRDNEQDNEIKKLRRDLNRNVVRNSDLDRFEDRMNRRIQQSRESTLERIDTLEKNVSRQIQTTLSVVKKLPDTD